MEMFQFLTVLLLTFGLGLLIAGIFTAYFGRGKSRMVGAVLAVLGIVVGLLTWLLHKYQMYFGEGYEFMGTLITAISYVGAFLIGAVIALVIFLGAIMKT